MFSPQFIPGHGALRSNRAYAAEACFFFALLQGNPLTLCRRVRSQHRHLCSKHIQFGLMLVESQDNGLNAHDLAASYKTWRLCSMPPDGKVETRGRKRAKPLSHVCANRGLGSMPH